MDQSFQALVDILSSYGRRQFISHSPSCQEEARGLCGGSAHRQRSDCRKRKRALLRWSTCSRIVHFCLAKCQTQLARTWHDPKSLPFCVKTFLRRSPRQIQYVWAGGLKRRQAGGGRADGQRSEAAISVRQLYSVRRGGGF